MLVSDTRSEDPLNQVVPEEVNSDDDQPPISKEEEKFFDRYCVCKELPSSHPELNFVA